MRISCGFVLVIMVLCSELFAADLERGRTLYSQICFNCHGPQLDGGIGPSLKDNYWRHGSSPEAILAVINKGVPGSEMIGFEAVFPESDRIALRDFIISEQIGLREVVRSIYSRSSFKGKRFTPELFNSVESESQTPLPENWYYMPRSADGVMRGVSKLYIKDGGSYEFEIRPIGRTSIYVDGKEVHYSDEGTNKKTHINLTMELNPGVYTVEILHEEKTAHSYRFTGELRNVKKQQITIPLAGRSLEGSIPKIVRSGQVAKVVRKWIDGLPPRTLLFLLPNSVIIAYDLEKGTVLQAWHSAEIDQTPSLPDRSTKPSEIRGQIINHAARAVFDGPQTQFLYYEIKGDHVVLASLMSGQATSVIIAPDGDKSFSISAPSLGSTKP